MSLRTLERDAPSLSKNRLPAPTQLAVFCALSLALMVADARLRITAPLRQALATVLYPVQLALLQPLRWISDSADYLEKLEAAQRAAHEAEAKITAISLQAHQAQLLAQENRQLRGLLNLRERLPVPAQAAEVVYESPDRYSRRIILDQGQMAGIVPGSPVMDAAGVLGQVVRVQPFTSEVRLLVDRDQAIPTEVSRTGVRGVMYGLASNLTSDTVELRYLPRDSDVQPGDALVTSGLDVIYPPGLPVAVVTAVERQGATAFLRIDSQPLAKMQGTRHVLVLTPRNSVLAAERPIAQELATLSQSNADAKKKARDDKSAQRRATPAAPPGQERQP